MVHKHINTDPRKPPKNILFFDKITMFRNGPLCTRSNVLRFLSTLWQILQVIAHHIQDKLTVSFDSSSIGLISYNWFLTIYAKYSFVKTYNEEDSIFLEKKYLF